MKVTRTLRPDADGTTRSQRINRARVLCLRYRLDPGSDRRLATVEPLAAETHPAHELPTPPLHERTHSDHLGHLRVALHQRALRTRVKSASGV